MCLLPCDVHKHVEQRATLCILVSVPLMPACAMQQAQHSMLLLTLSPTGLTSCMCMVRPYGRRAGLTNLMELKLEGCEDTTSVAALSGMRKLRTLSLKRCSALSYQKSAACVT